jgi:hypothetical protein
MKEFDYVSAWKKLIHPEFLKIYPIISSAYDETKRCASTLRQIEARHDTLNGLTTDLEKLYNLIPADVLAYASEVVYYYGHLAPDREAQDDGLYWKFQIIANKNLRDRGESNKPIDLSSFYIHKKESKYDNNEIPDLIKTNKILLKVEVENVNHKPDMFCIGARHFSGNSMYLDPNSAPCYRCGSPYSEHTSERVVFLTITKLNKAQLYVKKINTILLKKNIKVDGYSFIKG